MRYLADVLLVAWGGVGARKFRTGLIALGPFLGVVAIVAILGVSRSAKAQAREAIRELGADLVVVEAGGAISDGTSGLPTEAVERVRRVPGVESVAALAFLDGVAVSPTAATAAQSIDTAVIRVYTSDASLVRLLAAPVRHGRFLNTTDDAGRPVAVAGAGAARRLGLLPGEMRSILVGDQVVGVVGVLEHLSLLPDLDDAMFVASSYGATLVHDVGPTQLLVKTDESAANTVANLLTAAITYGVGEVPSVRVPTQLLAARAEVDRTFEVTVIAMGLLSLAIGGLGVANVLTISVLQRGAEIGIRRALGHTRFAVGLQFLAESGFVGAIGGVAGVTTGAGTAFLVARLSDWPVSLDPSVVVGSLCISLVVALLAGVHPALRASRLEPLGTLRES